MDELTSTEFRKVYGKLTEPTVVTVHGHPIGVWRPGETSWARMLDGASQPQHFDQVAKSLADEVTLVVAGARQRRRDELLRKINRR